MLATRLATAAVLVPLVVAGILWLPTVWVGFITAVVLAIGAWEWACLLHWRTPLQRGTYVLLFIVLTILCVGLNTTALLGLACFWWVLIVFWLLRFPTGWQASLGYPGAGAVVGLLVLVAAVLAVTMIHGGARGAALLLIFFVLVWGADTGAYTAGRLWGRRKLAPRVSPGKTLEGALGGVLTACIVAAASGSLLGYSDVHLAWFVVLGGWVAVVSIIGDLTLSMFKRHAGIKDSGRFFPGHGGVLDRLDSVLAAAPWFAVGLSWLAQG